MKHAQLRARRPSGRPLPRSLLLAAAVVAGLPAAAAAQTETVRLSGPSVAMYNLAGHVTIGAGSGSDVVVTVRRGGSDAARLQVESGPFDIRRGDWGEIETLRILYPSDRVRYEGMQGRTRLRVRDDGTFWGGDGWGDRGREVEISDRGGDFEAHADLEVAVPRGKRVVVLLAAGRIEARNVDGDLYLDTGSGEIVTAATRGELNLDTGSGAVTVDGADGEVSIDTGSGSVRVRNVTGPELSVDTGSGDVTVDGVEAPDISIDTGSGGVTVLGARTGNVEIDTGSGDVRIETVAGSASIGADTGSGDVTLSVPGDYAGRVSLETSSGRMETDLPITLLRKTDDEIEGEIGSGGSARIEVETGSGDIMIRRS